jgi:glycolate oxidase FAD binding subunit
MDENITALAEAVRAAASARTPLCIRAGGTKDFYGNAARGVVLDPRCASGIVAYEPSELVITARAGTLLSAIEATLAAESQMLAFEPPHFGAAATVGGCVAAGLAGPRRASVGPAHGSVRDFLLGARLIDGRGRLLSFGGVVMKNVSGYDVARALAGSLGILGVIVEVSLKVLPLPTEECTLSFAMAEEQALQKLNAWCGQPLAISASAWCDRALFLRLSGATSAVRAARAALGGEIVEPEQAATIWNGIREHSHAFFADDLPLWRLSVPSTTPALPVAGPQLIEWGGALRWVKTSAQGEQLRDLARQAGGHATLFRGGERTRGVFTPLSPALAAIHRRLKAQFDPAGIFNPGRMYPEF